MGIFFSKKKSSKSKKQNELVYPPQFKSSSDDKAKYKFNTAHFRSYSELEVGLRSAGLEACQLIVGIDFTKSNTWQGGAPYYLHDNLHTIDPLNPNPYQRVLEIMCKSLAGFDEDQLIDAFGFGDSRTKNFGVFPLAGTDAYGYMIDQPCHRLEGVLEKYNQTIPTLQFSGPTSFAPIIRKAIQIVATKKEFHILLIIADGAVDDVEESTKAIVEASKYPLSIVCVGVGKGPWDTMVKFDENIPERDFDNFHFFNFHEKMIRTEDEILDFAKNVLMEVPDQYQYIKKYIAK